MKENRWREMAVELNSKQLVNECLSPLWSDPETSLIFFPRKLDCVYS